MHAGQWKRRILRAACGLTAVLALARIGYADAANASRDNPSMPPEVDTSIGMEGVWFLRARGSRLVARHVEEKSPILLRIATAIDDGDTTIYELRYIGVQAGRFDLRDFLMHEDGQSAGNVPPAVVSVHSVLPEDHGGELEAQARPALPWPWPYRTLLVAAGVVWGVPVVVFVGRRLWRRKPPTRTMDADGEPTLADRLGPLVEAAVEGHCSTAQQAELERLLLGFWRERLDLAGSSPQDALRSMRRHAEAGKVLRRLESWLHQPPGRDQVDVPSLLAPYRRSPSGEEAGP